MKYWKKSLAALLIWPLLALSLEAQQLPDWQEGWMDIHHIATSQGDCILLILPDGTTWVLDAGDTGWPKGDNIEWYKMLPDDSKPVGERYVEYIRHFIRTVPHPERLDYVSLSHFHGDHTGCIHTRVEGTHGFGLSGMTWICDTWPVGTYVDRAWPNYDFPTRKACESGFGGLFKDFQAMIAWQQATYGMKAEVRPEEPAAQEPDDPGQAPGEDPGQDPGEDPGGEPQPPRPHPDTPVADLLDIVFQADGTAVDVSPSQMRVETFAGSTLSTYYNANYKRYAAHFTNELGATVTSGYYKIDYASNQSFKEKIADSHTWEAIVRIDRDPVGTGEIKMFSTQEWGGTGFLVSSSSSAHPNSLTFLVNTEAWNWAENVHNLGMKVNVWTVDAADQMLKYIGWGVDYITTNQPQLALDLTSLKFVVE